MKKIKIIDSIMGGGKSSWAIQEMNKNCNKDISFLYATPYLDECKRIRKEVKNRNIIEPNEKFGKGSKFRHLKQLVTEGENICCSHMLLKYADKELIDALRSNNYILILDEVMNVVELQEINHKDKEYILRLGLISVNKENRVIWTGDEDYDGKFKDIKILAENENLYMSRNNFMFWTFPNKIFGYFDDVYILTYMFKGQIQRYYYDYFKIEYDYYSIEKDAKGIYKLGEYSIKKESRKNIKKLVSIYEDTAQSRLNSNFFIDGKESFKHTELSSSWFMRATGKEIERLKNNLYTYFRNNCNSSSKYNLWTTKSQYQSLLKGKGYAKGFIALNIRATNDYQDKKNLAYVYNRYINPLEQAFFLDKDIRIDNDLLAISDLLQWIWRSRIRKGEPINIYIPSRRMRELLYKYLNYEI